MMMARSDVIRSSHNSLIKRFRSLGSRKHRDAERAFVVEGSRGIATALEIGITPQVVLLADDASAAMAELAEASGAEYRIAERAIFDSVMDTTTPQGIAAIIAQPNWSFPTSPAPFIVLLDGVGDPGNLGTIVRTAAAAGADAVVLGPACADPHGAKAARATMGAIFAIPVLQANATVDRQILERCPQRWLAAGGEGRLYSDPVWNDGVSVIIGSEGHGPSEWGTGLATGAVSIPLADGIESLNAAVAAAILIFEARRQRHSL